MATRAGHKRQIKKPAKLVDYKTDDRSTVEDDTDTTISLSIEIVNAVPSDEEDAPVTIAGNNHPESQNDTQDTLDYTLVMTTAPNSPTSQKKQSSSPSTLSQVELTQVFPEATPTPSRIPRLISSPPTRPPKSELDIMKKQLQAIEAEISHIPEIREFINQQHRALKYNKKHLKPQKRVHELEKKQLQAEEEIQRARNKLQEACNYNLDLNPLVFMAPKNAPSLLCS